MTEFWRRWRSATWHICEASPRHNAFSDEPDIYTMESRCGRHEFQRDGSRYIPWMKSYPPTRVCKACRGANNEGSP